MKKRTHDEMLMHHPTLIVILKLLCRKCTRCIAIPQLSTAQGELVRCIYLRHPNSYHLRS